MRTARHPEEIVLDLDATDDLIHGNQEGRFFHGYYGNYCYLPLYIFSGEHLLCARLRRSNIDGAEGAVEELTRIVGQIRQAWPEVKIIIRADSGFCRDDLMSWCEDEKNRVDYVLGLAKNERLKKIYWYGSYCWSGRRRHLVGRRLHRSQAHHPGGHRARCTRRAGAGVDQAAPGPSCRSPSASATTSPRAWRSSRRDFLLRQQMAAIRKELGESRRTTSSDDYRTTAALPLPDAVRTAVDKEIDRLERSGHQNPEQGWIRTWLDRVFGLPSGPSPRQLRPEQPWCSTPTTSACRTSRTASSSSSPCASCAPSVASASDADAARRARSSAGARGAIVALVGPAGVGKTSLGESVARAMGRSRPRLSRRHPRRGRDPGPPSCSFWSSTRSGRYCSTDRIELRNRFRSMVQAAIID